MKKRVLITGVNGFIGHSLWQYLKQKPGIKIFGLDRKRIHKDKNIFQLDIKRKVELGVLLSDIAPDYIFHLVGGRVRSKGMLAESNLLATQCLLDAVSEMPPPRPRVIIPGSAAEYGKMPSGKKMITEKTCPEPVTTYGAIKLKQTQLALNYYKKGGDVVIARIFNVLGKGTPPTFAVGNFAQQIVAVENGMKEEMIDTKDLGGKRDYLDIKDVCGALWDIARYGKSGEIYNICSGRAVTMKELLEKLLRYSKVKTIQVKESQDNICTSFDVAGSNRKLRSVTAWRPRASLEQGLRETLQYYRNLSREAVDL